MRRPASIGHGFCSYLSARLDFQSYRREPFEALAEAAASRNTPPWTIMALFSEEELVKSAGGIVNEDHYWERVRIGYDRMKQSSAVVAGLARNLGDGVHSLRTHVSAVAELFANCAIVLYENDSNDGTAQKLCEWASLDPAVHVISEELGRPFWGSTGHFERTQDMADYRNRCLSYVKREYSHFDYLILVDTDLRGGWSLNGIANSFGFDNWDFVGSVGMRRTSETYWYHYDAWAFRSYGEWGITDFQAFFQWLPRLGEALIPVYSCFGGLGIYQMSAVADCSYQAGDCEHVSLHQAMHSNGRGRLFMNPSQITVS